MIQTILIVVAGLLFGYWVNIRVDKDKTARELARLGADDGSAYDWPSAAKPMNFSWRCQRPLGDNEGQEITIGDCVELLRPSVAFSERGTREGVWEAGRVMQIVAASDDPQAVMFEGQIGLGWASGVLPASDVRLHRNSAQ